jgi:hypothetical protein
MERAPGPGIGLPGTRNDDAAKQQQRNDYASAHAEFIAQAVLGHAARWSSDIFIVMFTVVLTAESIASNLLGRLSWRPLSFWHYT